MVVSFRKRLGRGGAVSVTPEGEQRCTESPEDHGFEDKAADAIVAFGDAFLIPIIVRNPLDIDGHIDYDSAAYSGGKIAGFIAGIIPFALQGAAAFGTARLANSLLNSNRFFRIGPGRMPASGPGLPAGPAVPRISVGSEGLHLDLRTRVPPIPPVGAPVGNDGC